LFHQPPESLTVYYTDEKAVDYYLMGYKDCQGAGYNAEHVKNKDYNRGFADAARQGFIPK
jgi:hypothetical protein